MKKYAPILSAGLSGLFLLFTGNNIQAQSFNKGSLLISLTEGSTHSIYTTGLVDDGLSADSHYYIKGARDPLSVEYGITKKIGLGLTMGGDVLNIVPGSYNFFTTQGTAKSITSEITFDISYHVFNTKRTDISLFSSVGPSSVLIKGNDGSNPPGIVCFAGSVGAADNFGSITPQNYQYSAAGEIFRIGAKVRYYPFKHFGLIWMINAYSANYSPEGINGNNVGTNYYTSIKGITSELGICFRLLK